LRVLELAGLGPAPMACMLLADLGAEVVRVERPAASGFTEPRFDLLGRGRRSLGLDLKRAAGCAALLRLVARADVLVEGFRPGVAERLGVGPEACAAANPRLIYGRMTGWGQSGPLAAAAGHDINYLALTGALHAIGRAETAPVAPLNLVADFGGGALYLVAGILAALFERQRSGLGQVVDAAMLDGVTHMLSMLQGWLAAGLWSDRRGSNLLDSGAPFYDSYETADGKFVAIGALERRFFEVLADKLELSAEERARHGKVAEWPQLRAALAARFRTRSRAAWCELLEGSDACFAPVLTLTEAPEHPHNRARSSHVAVDGVLQAAAAPRFSRSVAAPPASVPVPRADTTAVLNDWGFGAAEIAELVRAGAIAS
jgi:alpha-methylacyl-CoA racemase